MASYGGGASEYGERTSREPGRGGRGGRVLRRGRAAVDLVSMISMCNRVGVTCGFGHGQW